MEELRELGLMVSFALLPVALHPATSAPARAPLGQEVELPGKGLGKLRYTLEARNKPFGPS
jgi:hypothetical protein